MQSGASTTPASMMARWVASASTTGGRLGGVECGTGLSGVQVPVDKIRDRAVVLAVDQDDSAVGAGRLEQAQQPVVVDDLVAVGHVDLEGRKPSLDQLRHLVDDIVADIRDNGVEAIVDDGVGRDFAEAPVTRQRQRLAPPLQREVDDCGDAPARARDCACKEVVGGLDPQAIDGVGQVGVGVDAPGHDPVAARIQDLTIVGQVGPDFGNPPVADEDVGRLHPVRGYHRASGDQSFAQRLLLFAGDPRTRAERGPREPGGR